MDTKVIGLVVILFLMTGIAINRHNKVLDLEKQIAVLKSQKPEATVEIRTVPIDMTKEQRSKLAERYGVEIDQLNAVIDSLRNEIISYTQTTIVNEPAKIEPKPVAVAGVGGCVKNNMVGIKVIGDTDLAVEYGRRIGRGWFLSGGVVVGDIKSGLDQNKTKITAGLVKEF